MCVCGGEAVFFSQDFLPIENQGFFFHSLRAKIFFSGQSKNKIFFSKQHICSKCIFFRFIHGYIVYMFVLGPRVKVHIKTFLISAI